MYLNEILSKPIPDLKISGKKPAKGIISNSNQKVLGIGAQAIAYLHSKFPGKVIKTAQILGTDDPIYQFLRLCLKHQSNPYFPKIYAVKMYKSGDNTSGASALVDVFNVPIDDFMPNKGELILYIVMEKLTPISQHNPILLRNLNIAPTMDDIADHNVGWVKKASQFDRMDIMFGLAFMNPAYRNRIRLHTTDPNLRQALRLMEPLFQHYHPDMHINNVMMRGQQLVFVDPISHIWSDDE